VILLVPSLDNLWNKFFSNLKTDGFWHFNVLDCQNSKSDSCVSPGSDALDFSEFSSLYAMKLLPVTYNFEPWHTQWGNIIYCKCRMACKVSRFGIWFNCISEGLIILLWNLFIWPLKNCRADLVQFELLLFALFLFFKETPCVQVFVVYVC
jgi:hypothetical protein